MTSSPRPTERLPAAHALHLAAVAEGLGVDRGRLFADWGLDEESLADPEHTLDLATVAHLVERTRHLTGEDGLGLYLGSRMQIANHGSLGFAAMTAPTARTALEVATRFVPTRTRALALRLEESEDRAALIIEERADFGAARDAVLVALVVGIWQIAQALTGRAVRGDVHFPFAAPSYARRFVALAPGAVHFGSADARLVFDRTLLAAPLAMADAAAHRRACAQCETELAQRSGSVADQVRRALAASPPPDLAELSRSLGLSARTLKRRLSDEHTTFGAVRAEVLERRARALLRTDHTLEQCASELGYCDAASFSRAFKRWAGHAPGLARDPASGILPG